MDRVELQVKVLLHPSLNHLVTSGRLRALDIIKVPRLASVVCFVALLPISLNYFARELNGTVFDARFIATAMTLRIQ
jgi:hypothetical protein